MSKKKVIDYDPKTGFGNFAEIMNANNAIDMAQNKVNTGMAPVTAPVANPAASVAGAPMKLETPTPTPVVGDAAAVSGDVVATGGGATVDTATETGATARPITSTAIISGPEQSEADWYAAQGLDPDKDYEEARAALEYDYETSMATYGQRAEELYQMGLSNSGVSDIYQLGAFNAYLKSQNDLAYQRIEAKKKNKQAYLAYDKEYQAGVKADTANAYNFGLEQFDWEMGEDGSFTTNNAEDIRAQLLAQGYDASIVDNVVNMLTALDPATLPTEKAQAAERKKAQEEANAKEELKSTAKRLAFNAYNTENIGEVETLLLNTPGVDSQMAEEILEYLGGLTPEDLADSTAYKKRQEEIKAQEAQDKATFDAQVKEATTIAENIWSGAILSATGKGYSGSVRKELEKQGFSKEVIDEAVNWINEMSKEDAIKWHYNRVTNIYDSLAAEGYFENYEGYDVDKKKISDSMKAAGYASWTIDAVIDRADEMLKAKAEIEEKAKTENIETIARNMMTVMSEDGKSMVFKYDGSASAKNTVKTMISGTDYEGDYDEIIGLMDAQLATDKAAEVKTAVANVENIDIKDISVGSINSSLQAAIDTYGRGSEEYKKIEGAMKSKIESAFNDAFDDVNGSLGAAYGLAGKTAEEWAGMDDADRIFALLEGAVMYNKNGYLGLALTERYFSDWFDNELNKTKGDTKATDQLIKDLKYFYDKGYIGKGSYDLYFKKIVQANPPTGKVL